ncbi:MAG: osmotically inducible protein OsmC [Flavobacteriales bacterium]|nr:osmotically inducible protein OsmC [Flavobacteriales bacterium]
MNIVLERINNDYLFEVVNSNGHRVLLDNKSKSHGNVKGISPMELLLMGLAGCSSIDVVAILNKQKINPTSVKMKVSGDRNDGEVPALFHTINVEVFLEGDFKPEKAQRAVDLSFDKYCSVSKTLEKTSKINYLVYLNGVKI